MRIAFVMSHIGAFRHFGEIIRRLCKDGHTVKVVFGQQDNPGYSNAALIEFMEEMQGFSCEHAAVRRDLPWRLLSKSRELINFGNYFRPGHPSSGLAARWKKMFSPRIWKVISSQCVSKLLGGRMMRKTLGLVERVVRPDQAILRWLEEYKPDVLVASPFITALSREIDYVKAAKGLEIPTVVVVMSWDNLTTKGTFHDFPNLTLVWNQPLVEEAVELHDVPRESIIITGAPTFDFWFDMKPSLDHISFCKQVGIDAKQPFITYLCSSTSITGDESVFVRSFTDALLESEETKNITVLIRPHPLNASIWKGFHAENAMVWPEGGSLPDNPSAKLDYYNQLFYSTAVVGVNTSAMVEAAIVDRPCVTIISDRYKFTQAEMGHFRHLVTSDFLEIANGFADAMEILTAIIRGRDSKSDNRKRFVREFIRPRGMDQSSSEFDARVIELAALRKSTAEIEYELMSREAPEAHAAT